MVDAWQDSLVEGSLAGVRVYWPASQRTGGRRTVNRELPGATEVYTVDLGKRPRRWSLEVLVLGSGYMTDRDKLIGKLEKPGPYTLIDPWSGEFQIELEGPLSWEESTARGGSCTFRAEVVQARGLAFPIFPDPAAAVIAAIIPVQIDAAAAFKSKFSLGKLKRLITSALANVTVAMSVVNGKIGSALGLVTDLANEINAINDQLETLMSTPDRLANALGALWDAIVNTIKTFKKDGPPGLDDGAGGDIDPFAVLSDALETMQNIDLGIDAIGSATAATADGVQVLASLQAINALTKQQTLAASAGVLAELVPDNQLAAAAAKKTWAGYFDSLFEVPDLEASETASAAKLKAAIAEYMTTVVVAAPQERTLDLYEATPALVIAHRVYGDARRDQDVIRRNGAIDPGLVVGPITVIQDG